MRNLHQDTRSVTGVFLAAAGAAMIEVLQNRQRLLNDLMGFFTFDMDHEADAAGVVLETRIVQALFGR